MIHVRKGNTDVMGVQKDLVGGNVAKCLPHTPLSERKLSKRLQEVERFEARISVELIKNVPCGGAVRRDLLEMELAALKRDRASIEEKLLLLFAPRMKFEGGHPMLLCPSSLSVAPIQGSERDADARRSSGIGSVTLVDDFHEPYGAGYSHRPPLTVVNRPARSDSACGRYAAYSGEESDRGVWSRGIFFGVSDVKTIEAKAVERRNEGNLVAKAQAPVDIKRMRFMNYAASGYGSAAPSLRGGGDPRSPIDVAKRHGVGNMVSRQSERCEMLCFSSTSPPQSGGDSRRWIAPPLAPEHIKPASCRSFDSLEFCASSSQLDLNDAGGRKGSFRVPIVLSSGSSSLSKDLYETQRRGSYSPSYQSPTPEPWTASRHDWQLGGVGTDGVGGVVRREQRYPVSMSENRAEFGGEWQQIVGHNRHVQTGGWSEEALITGDHVNGWRRTMPVAIAIDARQGGGDTTSCPYRGRNGDFGTCGAWDTGFRHNIPQQTETRFI